MNFGENLLKYAKSISIASQKELAKKVQENEKTLSSYTTERSYPTYKKLVKICNLLQCDPNTLMQGDFKHNSDSFPAIENEVLSKYKALSSHDREIVDYILNMKNVSVLPEPIQIQEVTKIIYKLPVYQQDVAAGSGQLGFDQKHHMEEFDEINIPPKVSYGIKIKGDSMVTDDENNIPDGSTILVTTDFDTDDLIGEAVVVNIGGVLVCKEYNIAKDGHLWLKSRNPQKSNEDRHIYDIDRVKIIGKVVKAIY